MRTLFVGDLHAKADLLPLITRVARREHAERIVLSATFAITHLYSGFNPNHHVIVRAHESYTDPPAPVIDSINNRQLRQSGGTRYLKVSRTVLDKEKQ